jgi:hypothetical protein
MRRAGIPILQRLDASRDMVSRVSLRKAYPVEWRRVSKLSWDAYEGLFAFIDSVRMF